MENQRKKEEEQLKCDRDEVWLRTAREQCRVVAECLSSSFATTNGNFNSRQFSRTYTGNHVIHSKLRPIICSRPESYHIIYILR